MYRKRSSVQIEVKEVDSRTGAFAGWGSVFDVKDDGGDTVRPGAFKASLEKRMPKIYLEHHTSVGVFTVAEERDRGLWVEGLPDESRDGLDAREKIKSRALDGLSIGFIPVTVKETGRFERDLIEIDLFHVGLVPFGMNDQAVITQVKARDLASVATIRDLERLLRDAGFSIKAAERICSPGFIAELKRGEPVDGMAELVAAMDASTELLRNR